MLRNNTVLRILSLLIAIFMWFYVMGEVNPTITKTISNIPVTLLNEDTLEQRGLAVQDNSGFTVSIVVKGKRAELNSMSKGDIKATADLFGYKQGENYVPVQVQVPDNITLKEVKTPKIQVTLEELVSVYKAISVRFTGNSEAGTEPGKVSVYPQETEIKGAKSMVESVRSVRVEIDAEELSDQMKTFSVSPVAVDAHGNEVGNVSLSASSVEVRAIKYHTKTVPLKVRVTGSVPKEYEVTDISIPEEITIRGTKDALERITSISAENVDIRDVTASTTIPVVPDLPQGVEVAEQSKNIGVAIKIKGLSTKTLTISPKNSKLENLGNGLYAYVNTAEIKVTITGSETLLKEISAADFLLSVDLKGLKAGNHTVPVKVTSDQDFNSLTADPEKVEVTIQGQN